MSSPVGDPSGFIDTQGLQLENETDGLIYSQVLKMVPAKIGHNRDFNQLTNDTVEKLFSLTDAAFEVTLLATEPELQGLLDLTLPVLASLPDKVWVVKLTDQSNRSQTLTGSAILNDFTILDEGVGLTTIQFTLEFISGAVSSTQSNTTGVLSV